MVGRSAAGEVCADLIDREAATVWGAWQPGAHEADRDTGESHRISPSR
jgi:hypothetical protein